jgi:membrane protein DedA with SNARE-associated domain
MIESFFGVFALAIVEMWAAIPLGFHLELPPVLLAIAVATGAFFGAVVAMLAGNGIRRLIFWRKAEAKEGSRLSQWLARKGPWAVGILGPLLMGPMFAALLAGAIGLPRALSLTLLSIGILVWTAIIVALGTFGLVVLR